MLMTNRLKSSFATTRSLILVLLVYLSPASAEPFPVDLLVGNRIEISGETTPVFDPSGDWLAYAVLVPSDRKVVSLQGGAQYLPTWLPYDLRESRLKLLHLPTGKELDIGPEGKGSLRCSWSPSGRRLAFYVEDGDRVRLCLVEAPHWRAKYVGELPLHVSKWIGDEPGWLGESTVVVPAALPGSRKWLSTLVPVADNKSPRHFDTAETEVGPETGYWEKIESVELFKVNVENGTTQSLGHPTGGGVASTFYASPSGRYVVMGTVPGLPSCGLYLKDLQQGGSWKQLSDLSVSFYDGWAAAQIEWHPVADRLFARVNQKLMEIDLSSGNLLNLGSGVFSYPFEFSEDGDYLFALQGQSTEVGRFSDVYEKLHLTRVPLNGGEVVEFPVPDATTEILRVDGRMPDLLVGSSIYSYSTDSQKAELLLTSSGRLTPKSANTDGVVVLKESQDVPPDLYFFDSDGEHRLTSLIESMPELPPLKIEYLETTFQRDGKEIALRTAVCLPEGATETLPPAVLMLYPGSLMSKGATTFDGPSVIPTRVFTSRGYAVIYIDTPISPPGRPGEPLRELVELADLQVDEAVKKGLVDPDRITVLGHSHGAYAAASLCAGSKRYRAGISLMGTYDLATGYSGGEGEEESFTGNGQYRMVASPWEDPERYRRNSPYQQADKIECPMLIVGAEKDKATPYWQSVFLWNALRTLGKDAELVLYPTEDHAPNRWSRDSQLDLTNRIVRFLEKNATRARTRSLD
jgi:dipeptidyl aminopeptidase/acylaminoacyl peptidase